MCMGDVVKKPEESGNPRKNAYIHHCEVVEQRMYYAVCLNRIEKTDRNALSGDHERCMRAMRRGECPALKMHLEEIDAGKAIYVIDRTIEPMKDNGNHMFMQDIERQNAETWEKQDVKFPFPPIKKIVNKFLNKDEKPIQKPKKPKTLLESIESGSNDNLAKAVSKAASEENKGGNSLREIAKQMMENRD